MLKRASFENFVIGIGGALIFRRYFGLVGINQNGKKEYSFIIKIDGSIGDQIAIIDQTTNQEMIVR